MTRRGVLGVVAAMVIGLGGCSGGSVAEPTPTPTTEAPAPSVEPAPEPDPVTSVAHVASIHGVEIELDVGPVAVDGDVGVLRIEAVAIGGDGRASLGLEMHHPYGHPAVGPTAVRLVDLAEGTVLTVAQEDGSRPVVTTGMFEVAPDGEPQVMHIAFPTPASDSVAVLLPRAGLVAGVPVVPVDQAPQGMLPLAELVDDADAELELSVFAMETFTEEVGGQVRTRVADGAVAVDVDSDVLFAVDSHELTAEADAVLAAAGRQVAEYAGGTLHIVGHTDDVGSVDYNQALSERRAQSAADRLSVLVDLDAYDLTVEGRGKSEPLAEGTSDEARALNRRVELRFVPSQGVPHDSAGTGGESGALPETDGPTASVDDGVEIEQAFGSAELRHYHVTVDSMRRIDGYLVGELAVTNLDEEDHGLVTAFAAGAWDARGSFDAALQTAATKVTLLRGDTRVYPLDYVTSGDRRAPVADRLLRGLDGGQTMTVTVLWPDVPGDTVVVDSPQRRREITSAVGVDVGGPPFRLTDVPVLDVSVTDG